MDRFQNKYRIPSARANWHGYNGGTYFVTICTKNMEHYFGEITCCHCRDGVHTVSTVVGTNNVASFIQPSSGVHTVSTVAGTNTEMTEPQMQLSPIGQYAHEQFVNVTAHYPYAEIPLFVVMPNHIHAIVMIDGENVPYNRTTHCRDGVHTASTGKTTPKMINIANMQGCRDGVHTVSTVQTESQTITNEQMHTVLTENRWKSDIVNDKMQTISKCKGLLSVVVGGLKRAITHYANEKNITFAWQARFHDRIVRDQNELNRIAEYIENNVANWQTDELNKME